jgi:hypothetical protein
MVAHGLLYRPTRTCYSEIATRTGALPIPQFLDASIPDLLAMTALNIQKTTT